MESFITIAVLSAFAGFFAGYGLRSTFDKQDPTEHTHTPRQPTETPNQDPEGPSGDDPGPVT